MRQEIPLSSHCDTFSSRIFTLTLVYYINPLVYSHSVIMMMMTMLLFMWLQETRLPCSEEALQEALALAAHAPGQGLGRAPEQGLGRAQGANAPLLVRTWLHDEGNHVEVVELGRDALLAAGVGEVGAWSSVLLHMQTRGMTRALVQTWLLLARTRPDVLPALLADGATDSGGTTIQPRPILTYLNTLTHLNCPDRMLIQSNPP